MRHVIRIGNGQARFVYDDALVKLGTALGKMTTMRASHVEPHPDGSGWVADMGPVWGPVLGDGDEVFARHRDCDCQDCEALIASLKPFPTRAAALAAERVWLAEHLGL